MVGYYLDEETGWSLDINELERAYKEARDNGTDVRALCLINPGNPTGQVLTKKNLEDVVEFAYDKNLVLMADEVYQENIYTDKQFYSA